MITGFVFMMMLEELKNKKVNIFGTVFYDS